MDPGKRHRITVKVSELELNALEDLLYADLTPGERKVLEEIVKGLWHKLVRAADRGR